jgi:hypothetical protein
VPLAVCNSIYPFYSPGLDSIKSINQSLTLRPSKPNNARPTLNAHCCCTVHCCRHTIGTLTKHTPGCDTHIHDALDDRHCIPAITTRSPPASLFAFLVSCVPIGYSFGHALGAASISTHLSTLFSPRIYKVLGLI